MNRTLQTRHQRATNGANPLGRALPPILLLSASLLVTACGGGGAPQSVAPGGEPTLSERTTAASATARNNATCQPNVITPFYWEIGDRDGLLASGSVGSSAPTRQSTMNVASASKWIYAAYVVQKRGARAEDVPYLNFTSGYTEFGVPLCIGADNVQACLAGRGGYNPANLGKFYYDSGHMQQHAVALMGLGALDNLALGTEVNTTLGTAGLIYTQPQLAGGVNTSTVSYSAFLRKILRGELTIGSLLGTSAVCTNPASCPTAVHTPNPTSEDRQYSLGHWVESDPVIGDGAFSSAGAFGYYPWIDAAKSYYGVLARESNFESEAGFNSARCGRLIRQAWVTGVEVTGTTPTPR